jgi:integrase
MSIYKRGTRWVAQASEEGRKVHVGTYATQREAKAALAAREAAQPSTSMTIAAWQQRWLGTPAWKPSTRSTNVQSTKAFVKAHGHRRMSDITRTMARDWVKANPGHHGALSAMFGAAVYDDIVPVNPFHKLVKRTTKKRDLQPEWLTDADVTALEQAAYQAHGPIFGATMAGMIRFAAETGVRPGELFVVGHSDLDVANGALYIRRAADSKNRIITTPKNGIAREVVLSERAALAASKAIPSDDSDRVFSSVRGGQFWANSFTWAWKPVKILAGRNDMQFYEMRHFCATTLLEKGLTAEDVAIQLGHTDGGELVRRVYGHPSDRAARVRLREIMDRREDAA